MKTPENFGLKLKMWRSSKGLSQKQVVAMMPVPEGSPRITSTAISKIEQGKTEKIGSNTYNGINHVMANFNGSVDGYRAKVIKERSGTANATIPPCQT